MPRNEARTYRDFPSEYAGFFLRIGEEGEAHIGPLDRSVARTLARDLNRYRLAIRRAIADDPGDEYLQDLARACQRSTVGVRLTGTDDAPLWFVRIGVNALVEAMEGGLVQYGPPAGTTSEDDC